VLFSSFQKELGKNPSLLKLWWLSEVSGSNVMANKPKFGWNYQERVFYLSFSYFSLNFEPEALQSWSKAQRTRIAAKFQVKTWAKHFPSAIPNNLSQKGLNPSYLWRQDRSLWTPFFRRRTLLLLPILALRVKLRLPIISMIM